MNNNEKESLTPQEETMLIFAARYAYDRKTAAAFAVCNHLSSVWDRMSDRAKKQIEREAEIEAHCCRSDWSDLFGWGASGDSENA